MLKTTVAVELVTLESVNVCGLSLGKHKVSFKVHDHVSVLTREWEIEK